MIDRRVGATAAAVWMVTFAVRFLYPEFENDHFVHLARARQILAGEVPIRDFVDPGLLLQYYASAVALWLSDGNLLGEVLLTVGLIATGTAIVFILASRLSGSIAIGIAMSVVVAAVYPRLYNYPKIFLYPLGLLCASMYERTPSWPRLALMAFVVAVSALLRYDHGAYIALAVLVVILVTHWRDGARVVVQRLGGFTLAVALFMTPYVAFLVIEGHLFRQARTIRSLSGASGRLPTPTFEIANDWRVVALEPVPLPEFNIRWTPSVTAADRADVDLRFLITPVEDLGGRSWRYTCEDCSATNLAALRRDPRVEDTTGIDGNTGALSESPRTRFWRRLVQRIPILRLDIGRGIIEPVNAEPWLALVCLVGPSASAIMLVSAMAIRRGRVRSAGLVAAAALLCQIINVRLLRGSLDSRLADVMPSNAVLLAWLVGSFLFGVARNTTGAQPPERRSKVIMRVAAWAVALPITALTTWAAWQHGGFTERLTHASVFAGPAVMGSQFRETIQRLGKPPIESGVTHDTGTLLLSAYMSRCTAPEDRLLVTGIAPEIYVYSNRSFAGGHVFLRAGWHSSLEEERLTLARLASQSVPIIVIHMGEYDSFQRDYSFVDAHIRQNYDAVADSKFGGRAPLRIMASRRHRRTGLDSGTGLPCFR